MISEETVSGYWYIPGIDEIPFNGRLTFGPQYSPRLTLIATKTHDLSDFPFNINDYTIWGYDIGGEPITLFECNRLNIQSAGGGVQTADFNASFIVFGGHITSKDDKEFDSVRFSFAGMEEWMGVFGQEVEFDGIDINSYQLSVNRPRDIPFKINEEISGAWSFWTGRPYVHTREIRLQQDNLFKLEFNPLKSLAAILEEIWTIQALYTLFTFEQTWVRWVYVERTGRELRLFYRQTGVKAEEPKRSLPLLQFRHINSSFENAISTWIRLRPSLRQVMAILSHNIGDSGQFIHNNFLNLVQAVEVYHRRILQNTESLKASNEPRVARILAAIENLDDREWLENRLGFSYEPNLATRLKELLNVHGLSLFEEPPSKKLLNKLIRNIVDKRNYFTHYDASLEKQDDETVILINLTRFLTLLLAYCLLHEIGYDSEFLKERVYRRYRFKLSKGKKNKFNGK